MTAEFRDLALWAKSNGAVRISMGQYEVEFRPTPNTATAIVQPREFPNLALDAEEEFERTLRGKSDEEIAKARRERALFWSA